MNQDGDDVRPGRTDSNDAPYEEIEHTADWSFRVRGRDLSQLFSNAAYALSSMAHDRGRGETTITREVQVEGVDRETLLVNWLNELLHLEHTRSESYAEFDILEIGDNHLYARIRGGPESKPPTQIKAVTFHNLEVKETAKGWEATLVVDV